MYKVWNKRLDVSLNMDSFKIFQKYIENRNTLNLDNMVPTVQINQKAILEKITSNFNLAILSDVKYKPSIDTLTLLDEKEKIQFKIITPELEVRKDPIESKLDKFKEDTTKRSITEDGMIVMNLSLPKSIVNNKRSSRSLTRRSANVSNVGSSGRGDNGSRSISDIPEGLSALFNLPFMIPAALPDKEETSTSNEVLLTLHMGPKERKDSQVPIDTLCSILSLDQFNTLTLERGHTINLNRTNDNINIRESIFKGLFPGIPFKKRYSVTLRIASS